METPNATDEEAGSVGTTSEASLPSQCMAKMGSQFPVKSTSAAFKQDFIIFKVLRDILCLDLACTVRMEHIGHTTATIIVNEFGLANNDIAQAFGLMEPSHIFNDQCDIHVLRLIFSSRTQTTDGQVAKPKTKMKFVQPWSLLKKKPIFNRTAENN